MLVTVSCQLFMSCTSKRDGQTRGEAKSGVSITPSVSWSLRGRSESNTWCYSRLGKLINSRYNKRIMKYISIQGLAMRETQNLYIILVGKLLESCSCQDDQESGNSSDSPSGGTASSHPRLKLVVRPRGFSSVLQATCLGIEIRHDSFLPDPYLIQFMITFPFCSTLCNIRLLEQLPSPTRI